MLAQDIARGKHAGAVVRTTTPRQQFVLFLSATRAMVRKSSTTQTLMGVLTAGAVKSVTYAAEKVAKRLQR